MWHQLCTRCSKCFTFYHENFIKPFSSVQINCNNFLSQASSDKLMLWLVVGSRFSRDSRIVFRCASHLLSWNRKPFINLGCSTFYMPQNIIEMYLLFLKRTLFIYLQKQIPISVLNIRSNIVSDLPLQEFFDDAVKREDDDSVLVGK